MPRSWTSRWMFKKGQFTAAWIGAMGGGSEASRSTPQRLIDSGAAKGRYDGAKDGKHVARPYRGSSVRHTTAVVESGPCQSISGIGRAV